MLHYTDKGIYCPAADLYVDPWKPVKRAVITHAHSDHARPGMDAYLCTPASALVLQQRLGAVAVQTLAYGEKLLQNGVQISLHPAGHIWGSAQVRLEYKGEIWVISGDYKVQPDGISTPFEPIRCHGFVTESTFGLPIYRFPDPRIVEEEINQWWAKNRDEGRNSVLLAYALGKAQRVIRHLDPSIGAIYTHGAVDNVNALYCAQGGVLPPTTRIDASVDRKQIRGAMIVAPPSAAGTPWLRSLRPWSQGVCSGWMQLRGARRRRGADKGFVLSDHADWPQLNEAVLATGAGEIVVTHGYKSVFSRWLSSEYKLNAFEIETDFHGDEEDAEDNKQTNETV